MSASFRFLDFRLSPAESRLERSGVEVVLQPKVLDALLLFVANQGQLLTKERLLAELWPDVVVGEEALTQVVRKLRQALGDDIREPRFIQTVLKRGYRFLPEVVEDERSAPAPRPARLDTPSATAAMADESRSPRGRARLLRSAVLVTVLALSAGVMLVWRVGRGAAPGGVEWRAARLTAQPEREQEGVFSPDGRSYAFEANVEGQFDLFVALFSGGRRVRLTETPDDDEFYPQFAADGGTLVFTREPVAGGAPSVWAVPTFGGDEVLLVADASYGALSPDGTGLAYARFLRDGLFALRFRELEGGEERELARTDEWLGSVAWSPDGGSIAFATPTKIWLAPLAGTPRALVTGLDEARTVSWEPDGSAVWHDGASAGPGGRIWRQRLDGPAEPLTGEPSGAWHPAMARDGRRILVTVEHKTRQLWRADADGRDLRPLPLPTTAECFDVDSTGERLVWSDWEAAPGQGSLKMIEIGTGTTRALGDGLCPAFSPDGRSVAYLSVGDPVNLETIDLGSGDRRIVARELGAPGFVEANLDRRPSWSPDGQRLAVERAGKEGWRLELVDLRSQEVRTLVEGELETATFSPDGSRLAVCAATPLGSGLHLIELESGAGRRITADCSYRSAPIWSADGTTLRFLRGERRDPRLVAVDLEGKLVGEDLHFERPADPAFWGIFEARALAANGWIVFSERYEGDLFLLERAPG